MVYDMKRPEVKPRSRLADARADAGGDENYWPELPPLRRGAYLVDYLWDAGPLEGEHQLSHTEMQNYQRNTGVSLHPWEVRVVRRLSAEYLNEMRAAEDKLRDAPWWKTKAQGLALGANQLQNSIRSMAAT